MPDKHRPFPRQRGHNEHHQREPERPADGDPPFVGLILCANRGRRIVGKRFRSPQNADQDEKEQGGARDAQSRERQAGLPLVRRCKQEAAQEQQLDDSHGIHQLPGERSVRFQRTFGNIALVQQKGEDSRQHDGNGRGHHEPPPLYALQVGLFPGGHRKAAGGKKVSTNANDPRPPEQQKLIVPRLCEVLREADPGGKPVVSVCPKSS
jgi:hypothetical protein